MREVPQPEQTERRCKSLPRMRSVRSAVADNVRPMSSFTFALDENYPPCPGYTGHIPQVNRATIIGRSVASAARLEREKLRDAMMTSSFEEKNVGRYQEQTASSRAKQVRIYRNYDTNRSTSRSNMIAGTTRFISETEDENQEVLREDDLNENVYEHEVLETDLDISDDVNNSFRQQHFDASDGNANEGIDQSYEEDDHQSFVTKEHHETIIEERAHAKNDIKETKTIISTGTFFRHTEQDPVRLMLSGKMGSYDTMGLRRPTSARPIQRDPVISKDPKKLRSTSAEPSRNSKSRYHYVQKTSSTTKKESSSSTLGSSTSKTQRPSPASKNSKQRSPSPKKSETKKTPSAADKTRPTYGKTDTGRKSEKSPSQTGRRQPSPSKGTAEQKTSEFQKEDKKTTKPFPEKKVPESSTAHKMPSPKPSSERNPLKLDETKSTVGSTISSERKISGSTATEKKMSTTSTVEGQVSSSAGGKQISTSNVPAESKVSSTTSESAPGKISTSVVSESKLGSELPSTKSSEVTESKFSTTSTSDSGKKETTSSELRKVDPMTESIYVSSSPPGKEAALEKKSSKEDNSFGKTLSAAAKKLSQIVTKPGKNSDKSDKSSPPPSTTVSPPISVTTTTTMASPPTASSTGATVSVSASAGTKGTDMTITSTTESKDSSMFDKCAKKESISIPAK